MNDKIFEEIKQMNKKREEKRKEKEEFTKKYTETFKEALAGRNIVIDYTEYYDTIYGPASYLKTSKGVTIYIYPHMGKEKFVVNYNDRTWRPNSISDLLSLIETL